MVQSGSGYSEGLVLSGNSFLLDAALGESTAIQFIAVRLCVLTGSLCLWEDAGLPCFWAFSQSLSQQEW